MQNNIILYIIATLLIIPCMYAETIITKEYNITQLPIEDNMTFTFKLQENESIYFQTLSDDPNIDIDYPQQVNFSAATQTIRINFIIHFFGGYTGNQTILLETLGVTNSLNTNITQLQLRATINHFPEPKNTSNITEPFSVNRNGSTIEIVAYDLADLNFTHRVNLSAPPGEKVAITCGEFFRCPIEIIMPSDGDIEFSAQLFVSKTTPAGVYDTYVRASFNGSSAQTNFTIRMKHTDDVYKVIRYDFFRPDCFESPEKLAECYREASRYQAEVYNALLDRIRYCNISETGNRTIVYNETVKYVEVGNIDPELLEDNRQCRTDNEELRKDYNTCAEDYRSLEEQYDVCRDRLSETQEQCNEEMQQTANAALEKKIELENEFNQKEQDIKRDWWAGAAFIFFIGLIGSGALWIRTWYDIYYWRTSYIPTWGYKIVVPAFGVMFIISIIMSLI